MISFWMRFGHDPNKFVNMNPYEKAFWAESMNRYYEEEEAKYNAIYGEGKK